MAKSVEVHGYCDKRFSAVKDVFASNLNNDEELGATFAATINGKFVVDLWGGYTDVAKTRPWEKDTLTCCWSNTKVMTALCAHILVDRGLLDLDAPVAKYWPEFAQEGKGKISVRQILSHTSGLAHFEEPIAAVDLCDWNKIITVIARQKKLWWEPGTQCGYHGFTYGYIIGEIVRRITHKSIGKFFQDEVAVPLGAEFYLGVPEKADSRVAEILPEPEFDIDPNIFPPLTKAIYANPPQKDQRQLIFYSKPFRAAECPGVNGHGNARSMARVGALMACGGELDGRRLISQSALEKVIEVQFAGVDQVMSLPVRWGLGVLLMTQRLIPLRNPRAFLFCGRGGSQLVVDYDDKLSFAYAGSKMVLPTPPVDSLGDNRVARLTKALYDAM